jgi:UDP-glucose 4-epimerase
MGERRCFVTGVAGFIGSHIADRFIQDGFSVTGIDNESTGCRANVNPRVNYIRGDVRSLEDLERGFRGGLDVVVHLAGQASTIKSFEDPSQDLAVNTVGTMNVLQLCLKYKVPRLLYASSMTVYGHPDRIPTRETDSTQPVSYYGITKYAAERYVHSTAARNDLDFNFAVTSFRMFNVYGERQSLDNPYQGVLAIFIARAMNQEPITIFGDGEQSRDFVYISDVVDAWVGSIDNPRSYDRTFNLGSGHRKSVNEVVDAVLKQFGLDRSCLAVQYEEARPGDQRHMEADIEAARAVLGWEPQVSFGEGLERTIRWACQSKRSLTSTSHPAEPS